MWELSIAHPSTIAIELHIGIDKVGNLSKALVNVRFLRELNLFVANPLSLSHGHLLEHGFSKNRSLKTVTIRAKLAESACLQAIVVGICRNPCITSLDLSHTTFPVSPINQTLTSNTPYISELAGLEQAQSPLKYLNISSCNLPPVELISVSKAITSANCKLVYINISRTNLEFSASTLAKAIETNTSLTRLDVGFCNLGDHGASSFGKSLTINKSLLHLDISGNSIGPAGAESVADGLSSHPRLGTILIGHNPLNHEGCLILFESFSKCDTLRTIDVSFCGFSKDTWFKLAQVINTWPKLWSLNIAGNMTFASELPEVKALQVAIHAQDDPEHPAAAPDIPLEEAKPQPATNTSEFIRAITPKNGDNLFNVLDSATSKAQQCETMIALLDGICSALQTNSSLTILDLSHNTLDYNGALLIASLLKNNHTLVDVRLRRCGISSKAVSVLADSITDNPSISFVDITGNEADTLGHMEPILYRNRIQKSLAWKPLLTHPIVQSRPHADFTSVCAVRSRGELWVACTDGHIHFWPVIEPPTEDDVLQYLDVHQSQTMLARRRINYLTACSSTIWVLTDDPSAIVVTQSKPHRVTYLPGPYGDSGRLCMTFLTSQSSSIAVIGGACGDISLYKATPGEEALIKCAVLAAGYPVVSIVANDKYIIAGLIVPNRQSSLIVILDLTLEELYRQEIGTEPLTSMCCFGDRIITVFNNSSIKVWNCDPRETVLISTVSDIPAHSSCITGQHLITASNQHSGLVLWNPATLSPISSIPTPNPVKTMCMGSNFLAMILDDERVSLWTINYQNLALR